MKDLGTEEIASLAGVTTNMVKKVLMLPKTPRSLESMIGTDKNMKLSVYFLLNHIFFEGVSLIPLQTLTFIPDKDMSCKC